jgi:hypothetical protein
MKNNYTFRARRVFMRHVGHFSNLGWCRGRMYEDITRMVADVYAFLTETSF